MQNKDIAVIGLACKYPKSNSIDEFWDNLCQNKDCITRGEESKERNVISAFGAIDNIYGFDNEFFKCSDRDAMSIAPQERLAMQLAYAALEDAGISSIEANRVGIVCGAAENEYHYKKMKYIEKYEPELHMAERLNNGASLTSRIAFKLNLKGPAMVVDTACSTSLSAIHLASAFLRNDEADVMLAGGVCVLLNQDNYNSVEAVMSSDGYTRAYDQSGTGFVPGNGGGIVALKLLDRAIADGDHIYAIIKGSAVNNDGSNKVGYTAPSTQGHIDVINQALINAQTEPSQIDYIEGHGTATVLGDAVEIRALKKVYGNVKEKNIGIGSLKSNFGHLNSAAGVAGFMKCVLALDKKFIPATIHVDTVNSELGSKTNLTIQTENRVLENRKEKYRVAVSSIGIGGSNAHIVLEEYAGHVTQLEESRENKLGLLLISNKNEARLKEQIAEVEKHVELHGVDVDAAMYTLGNCRVHYDKRVSIICNSHRCESVSPVYSLDVNQKTQRVMLFPGTGTSYDGLGRELLEHNVIYRKYYQKQVDAFNEIYPEIDFINDKSDEMSCVRIVVTEYALAMTLIELGVEPDVLLGYSLGEYVAAAVSGILDINTVISIVYERAKIINELQNAHMFLLGTGADSVSGIVGEGIYIAGFNAHDRCLMTCNDCAYDKLIAFYNEHSIFYQELGIKSPGHSKELSIVEDRLIPLFANLKFSKGKYKIVSTYLGRMIEDEMESVEYWMEQMKNPVLFTTAIASIYETEPNNIFIHIGADAGLVNYIRRDYGMQCNVVELLRQNEETNVFLQGLGKLWCLGERIAVDKLTDESCKYKVSLPHYRFNERDFNIIDYFQVKYGGAERKSDENFTEVNVENSSDRTEYTKSNDEKIIEIIKEVTSCSLVNVEDEVATLGVDSLSVIMIQTKLQSEFNCDITVKELYACSKVSDLIELVVSKASDDEVASTTSLDDEVMELSDLFKLTEE